MKTKIVFIISLIAGLLILAFIYNKYRVAPSMDFFALEVYDEHGNKADLSQFKNKKIIVTYWASWCGECRKELQLLNEIKESHLQGIEIVALTDDPLEKMNSFMQKKNYPFHFYRFKESFSRMNVNAIPVNYLVNTKGKTVYEKVGSPDWNDNSFVMKAKEMMD